MAEYALVAKDAETALKKTFGADMVMHLLLMFVDKHTHFHIYPRYSKLKKFSGIEWVDDFKPDPLAQRREEALPPEVLNAIKNELKKQTSH